MIRRHADRGERSSRRSSPGSRTTSRRSSSPRSIANAPSDDESDAWLAAAERDVRARGLERAADAPEIAAWRAAFSAFGAKPRKYPCSAEALAARVLKGGELRA